MMLHKLSGNVLVQSSNCSWCGNYVVAHILPRRRQKCRWVVVIGKTTVNVAVCAVGLPVRLPSACSEPEKRNNPHPQQAGLAAVAEYQRSSSAGTAPTQVCRSVFAKTHHSFTDSQATHLFMGNACQSAGTKTQEKAGELNSIEVGLYAGNKGACTQIC
eukprot:8268-Pelagomonas_calceolata.AAC.3